MDYLLILIVLDSCISQDNSVSIKRKTKRKPLIKPSNNYYH